MEVGGWRPEGRGGERGGWKKGDGVGRSRRQRVTTGGYTAPTTNSTRVLPSQAYPSPPPLTWQGVPCPVASMRKRKCSSQVRQNSMSGSGLCARTSSRNAGMKYRACGTAGSGAS